MGTKPKPNPSMPMLHVHKSIEVNATPSTVWRVLVEGQFTNQWWREFDAYGGVESDWRVGSEINWKNKDDVVYVKGTVDTETPNKLLQFTTFDVKKPQYTITFIFTLTTAERGRTKLTIEQGDFAKIPDGEKICGIANDIWGKTLPIIKKLAEE